MGKQGEEVSIPLLYGVNKEDFQQKRSKLNSIFRMLYPINTRTILGWT